MINDNRASQCVHAEGSYVEQYLSQRKFKFVFVGKFYVRILEYIIFFIMEKKFDL